MQKRLRLVLCSAVFGAAQIVLASAAQAQQAPSPPAINEPQPNTKPNPPVAEDNTLGEVIVTARRVSESLQSVPIPVTSFTGAQLEQGKGFTPIDLTREVPNLKVFKGLGNSNTYAYYIRGVGRDIGYAYAESQVSLYVDDVFYPYQAGPNLQIGGIDHVEVLRGPQGTLYGKNSTVGTIKFYTVRPDVNGEQRSFTLTGGSYGRFETQLSESMPLIDGKLAARVDLSNRYYDGYLHDLVSKDTVGGVDSHGGRFSMLYKPDEKNEIYFSADVSSSRDEIIPWSSITYNANKTAASLTYGDPYTVATYEPHVNNLDVAGGTLQAKTEWNGLVLKSISSFRGFHQDFVTDSHVRLGDTTSWNEIRTHDNTWTQEFTATGGMFGDRLTYVGGAFFLGSTTSIRFLTGTNTSQWTHQNSYSEAVYLDGSYRITDKLRFNAGGRYSADQKDDTQDARNAANTVLFSKSISKGWNDFTPKVGLDYQLNSNLLLFAVYSEGFKGGGLSTGQPTASGQVLFIPPETSANKEVGIKSEWFSHRLRVNMNYFDTDYKNTIATIYNPLTNISNVSGSDAHISGFEFEGTARPWTGWTFNLKLSTLDAKYVNVQPGFTSYGWPDQTLKHAPDLTYDLGAAYEFGLANGRMTLSVDYNAIADKTYESLARDVATIQPPYDVLGARAVYDFPDPRWQAVLDITNAADRTYFVLGGTGFSRNYAPPREFIFSLHYKM